MIISLSTKKATSENSKKVVLNAISVLDELKKPHYITELAKERIRRAGKKIKEKFGGKTPKEWQQVVKAWEEPAH